MVHFRGALYPQALQMNEEMSGNSAIMDSSSTVSTVSPLIEKFKNIRNLKYQ